MEVMSLTDWSLLRYKRYDTHSKCLNGVAVLLIVIRAVQNAGDTLRDTPYMEFASTLKNIIMCHEAWHCVQLADDHFHASEKF